MGKLKDPLALDQIERRIGAIRKTKEAMKVRPGWIHYMRKALGMKLEDLANCAGLSLSTVAQAERREAEGKVTLATLKQMAEAMECQFVYAFVPKTKIKSLLKGKALTKARAILTTADTHMTLEDQKVTESFERRVERLATKLLQKGDIW